MLSSKYDLIIIDAGHGGKDPGCVYNELKEKDLTLKIAKLIYFFLSGNCYLLRDSDQTITLSQRIFAINNFIKLKKKPFLISLHVNDYEDKEAEGAEIFYCLLNPDYEDTKKLAKELLEIYTTQLKLKNRGVKECLDSQPFHFPLLKETQSPSIIFELGFIRSDFFLKKTNLKEKLGDIALIISTFIRNYLSQ